jgi:hypothetical protein
LSMLPQNTTVRAVTANPIFMAERASVIVAANDLVLQTLMLSLRVKCAGPASRAPCW